MLVAPCGVLSSIVGVEEDCLVDMPLLTRLENTTVAIAVAV